MDLDVLSRLEKLADRLNGLTPVAFQTILSTVFDCYTKNCAKFNDARTEHYFSNECLNNLKNVASFGEDFLLDSILHVLLSLLENVSKSIVKPKILYNCLIETGLSADKTEFFVTLWKTQAGRIVDLLKTKSFDSSAPQLKDTNWKIKVLSDQSVDSQQKLPFAEINFVTNDNGANQSSLLSLNFTHAELLAFYNNLENIQNKIDALNT